MAAQRHGGAWITLSQHSSTAIAYELSIGESLGGNERTISGADIGGRSRFVHGWICAKPAKSLRVAEKHSSHISWIRENCFYLLLTSSIYPFSKSSFRIRFTRGDGHCSLHIDQTRRTLARASIPSISPISSESASADTYCPPRSHRLAVQRGQRRPGGSCDPDRRPSAPLLGNNLFLSTLIRHSTTHPNRPSHTKAQAHDEAYLAFSYSNVSPTLQQRSGAKIALGISCRTID
jgi:hypothetical protein